MSEISKKYIIQQKQKDGTFLTLHPQTVADIVLETETHKVLTADERTKLAGISAGAEANVIAEIKLGSTTLTPSDKVVTIPVDSALSASSTNLLSNAVITAKFTDVEGLISANAQAVKNHEATVGALEGLSTNNKSSIVSAINEIKTTVGSNSDLIAANTAAIGTNTGNIATNTADVAGLKTSVGTLNTNVSDLQTGKVDKVDGKGLSTNDYTTVEKEKLATISSGAQANVIEGVSGEIKSGELTVNASVTTDENKVTKLSFDMSNLFNAKVDKTVIGVANGVASLDSDGKVPSSQLPSYVDDVVEGTLTTFPAAGSSDKIYVDTNTNKTYRWSGTQYVEISASLALGETASTAYAGDKGAKNASDIATNVVNIAANTTAIGNLQTEVGGIKTSIGTAALETDNKTVKEAINELHTELNAISGTVASNETVAKLSNAVFAQDGSDKVAANAAAIAGLDASVSTINSSITALQGKDTEQAGLITGLDTRLTTAEGNIGSVTGEVATLKQSVGTNTSDIAGLKQADTDLDTRIDKLETITGALADKDKVTANTEAISANTQAIAEIKDGTVKAKSAETADKLATAVSVSVKGDVVTTSAVTFDGSSNLELEVSLPDKVAEGVYTAVQVDAKGRVIAGAKDIMVGDDTTDTSDLAVGGLFFKQI